MSRGLSTDIQNALASGKFGIASLLKLSLNTTYYLTNHQKNIVFNSATYQPLGYIVNLNDIVEQSSMNTGAISITLSAATTTIMTDLFTNGHIDENVNLYLALINDSGAVIDAPFEIYAGTISSLKYTESATSSAIRLTVSNQWSHLEQYSGRRLTDDSQQRVFDGDKSFSLRSQVGKKLTWGIQ